jgi:hypothetical protein
MFVSLVGPMQGRAAMEGRFPHVHGRSKHWISKEVDRSLFKSLPMPVLSISRGRLESLSILSLMGSYSEYFIDQLSWLPCGASSLQRARENA